MAKITEIDTERLRLRQWREADYEPFAALNADPRVMEFFPAPLDRPASDSMAFRCQAAIAERGWGLWAVETKELHKFIGFVGLDRPTAELSFSPCVEVGWRLAFSKWGKGFATEAARSVVRLGFEMLGLSEIVSFTTVRNFRSRAVMERLNMQEAADPFEHPKVPVGSSLRLHCLYRLSSNQWEKHVA